MFYEASDGKVFLAGIERVKDNPINPFGVRVKAMESFGMTVPLLEYASQMANYYITEGNRYQSDGYYCTWNYLHDLEIIKMYYQQQGKELPKTI